MNNNNDISKFISFSDKVELIRNLFIEEDIAKNAGVDKNDAIAFKLKDDSDIFILNTSEYSYEITLLKVISVENNITEDCGYWFDNTTVTDAEFIGFINGACNSVPNEHKLRSFLDELIRFVDAEEETDINHLLKDLQLDVKINYPI